MIRIALWVFTMLVFSLIETSFISSLPGILVLTPFVLAVTVYLVQHQGVQAFIWWLPLHGFFLDSIAAGTTRLEVLPYCVAACVVSLTAKHLFSNRSYYGVLSCALTGCVGLIATEALILFVEQLMHTDVHWQTFLGESLLRFVLLLIVLTLFYPFAKRIRSFLVSLALLPDRRKTY